MNATYGRFSSLDFIFYIHYYGDMKTTVDIPDKMLQELISNTAAHTKREAILTAIEEYNQKRRIALLADLVGTFNQFVSSGELAASRGTG